MGNTLNGAGPVSTNPFLTALIFGPSKTGKTTLAASAPKALILDLEGGTRSVADTDADVLAVDSWATFDLAVRELTMEAGAGYDSVVVDSVTFLQELAGREAKLLEMILSGDKDPRQAYGKIGAMIRHKLMLLHNLPMHTVFTAQLVERDQDDIAAGKYPLNPDVTPAIMKILMATPSLICRTAIKRKSNTPGDVEYEVIFGPDTRSQVGNRDMDLPYSATGVTMPKLIDIYQNGDK